MDNTAQIIFQCSNHDHDEKEGKTSSPSASGEGGSVGLEEILPHLELKERLAEKADEEDERTEEGEEGQMRKKTLLVRLS